MTAAGKGEERTLLTTLQLHFLVCRARGSRSRIRDGVRGRKILLVGNRRDVLPSGVSRRTTTSGFLLLFRCRPYGRRGLGRERRNGWRSPVGRDGFEVLDGGSHRGEGGRVGGYEWLRLREVDVGRVNTRLLLTRGSGGLTQPGEICCFLVTHPRLAELLSVEVGGGEAGVDGRSEGPC